MHRLSTRVFFLASFALCAGPAWATDYFVSAAGLDSAAGTSPQDPWATLGRVQAAESGLQPGDRVFFRAGDVFEGSLTLTSSGTVSAPIVFGSYGAGPAPVLDASQFVSGWSPAGPGAPGVWHVAHPGGATHPLALFADGAPQALAREPNLDEPNGGYLTVDTHTGNTTLVDFELPAFPDWSGAEAVIRTQRWILDRVPVQTHSGTTVQLAQGTFPYEIQNAFGYFFQDHPNALDRNLEWCFEPALQRLSLFLENGATPSSIRVPIEEHVLALSAGLSNVQILGLALRGARTSLVEGSGAARVTIRFCEFEQSAGDGLVLQGADRIWVEDNSFAHCQNNGILVQGGQRCILARNTVRDIGMLAGMGRGPDGNYFALLFEGRASRISRNSIQDVGYIGIAATGPRVMIDRNIITGFCSVKDDGGGIYVSGYGPSGTRASRVLKNIVSGGVGAYAGAYPLTLNAAHGVYIDDFATDMSVLQNTASDNGSYGIFLHNASRIRVEDNVCFGNARAQLAMIEDSIASTDIRGCRIQGNVFAARREEELAAEWVSESDDIALFGNFEGNAYLHAYRSSGFLRREYLALPNRQVIDSMGLAEWQAASNQDFGSTELGQTFAISEAYTYLEPERIVNGDFSSGLGAWTCWMLGGGGNACQLTADPNGFLDGLALRLGFSFFTGSSYALAFQELGPVSAGDKLLCQISARGTLSHAPLEVELRQDASVSYEPLSYRTLLETDSAREDHSFLLDVLESDPNARIDIGMEESTDSFWIDNVSVRRVAVNETGLSQRFTLFTNFGTSRQVFVAAQDSVDAWGNTVLAGSSVLLAPLESRLLITSP